MTMVLLAAAWIAGNYVPPAENDYKAFFKRFPAPLIVDEVQRLPELLAQIQVIVDENGKKPGQFVVTGSQQNELAAAVDESLAGRCCVLDLMPFALSELQDLTGDLTTDEILLRGLMPELWMTQKNPTLYYRNYFRTYVERDVRQVQNVTEISRPTAEKWISVLETSYIIFRLQPYYANIKKRLVKSPKLYFYDTGLACYLLGITKPADIEQFYLRGALFENLIVSDFLKQRYFTGLESNLFFYRDKNNVEVDLITKEFQFLKAYEIKAGATRNQDFLKNIKLLVRNGI